MARPERNPCDVVGKEGTTLRRADVTWVDFLGEVTQHCHSAAYLSFLSHLRLMPCTDADAHLAPSAQNNRRPIQSPRREKEAGGAP